MLKSYACMTCGYIYNPIEGDEENDIEAGIPFEELSDDWCCPLCGESKEMFDIEESY